MGTDFEDDAAPVIESEEDGGNPDEIVGPEHSEASVNRCETKAGPGDSASESSFDLMEEMHESFPIEEIPVVMAPDGLPDVVVPDPSQAMAVPFTIDTVLCLADDREYVELWADELSARGWKIAGIDSDPSSSGDLKPRWLPSGCPSFVEFVIQKRFSNDGTELERESFKPELVHRKWGVDLVKIHPEDGGDCQFVPVRPRREVCQHYKRQVFSNDDIPDPTQFGHQLVFRVCTARRSNGGAFMSVQDEGIYACDFRSPTDLVSIRVQDKKDKKKLLDRPDLILVPLLGFPGEDIHLDRPSDVARVIGNGIFASKGK